MNVATFPVAVSNLVSDLRNGTAAKIVPAARKGSIPQEYWYCPIGYPVPSTTAPAPGTAGPPTVVHGVEPSEVIEVYIRTYFSVLARGSIPALDATVTPQIDQAAVDAKIKAAVDSAELRAKAIVLGAARASIDANWSIVKAEWTASESFSTPIFTVSKSGPDDQPQAVAKSTAEHDASAVKLAEDMTPLGDAEWSTVYHLFLLAKAAPIMAGCQLLENGHHYLSSNTKATSAVERQMFDNLDASEPAGDFWRTNSAMVKDIVWHKAPHPIDTNTLTAFAIDKDVVSRFKAAGLGSAVVRLPYVESTVRSAKAMVAVGNKVSTSLSAAGHSIKAQTLGAAVTLLDTLGYVSPAGYNLDGYSPCASRIAFIEGPLASIVAASEGLVAWQIGWYKAVLEDGGLNVNRDTILSSYGIKRIINSHAAQVAEGASAKALWSKCQRAAAEKGDIVTINLVV